MYFPSPTFLTLFIVTVLVEFPVPEITTSPVNPYSPICPFVKLIAAIPTLSV